MTTQEHRSEIIKKFEEINEVLTKEHRRLNIEYVQHPSAQIRDSLKFFKQMSKMIFDLETMLATTLIDEQKGEDQ